MNMRASAAVMYTIALAASLSAPADVRPETGMMRWPDVSAEYIVFSYANDLWIAPREGGLARPLASPAGQETCPRFSPDGQTIAFVGNYDGNSDVYTLPVAGGVPFRVTHHPAGETLCDWTPDGGDLVFYSESHAAFYRRGTLFSVSPAGGLPHELPIPYGHRGSISPDGKWLAYVPHARDHHTWKRYRGGMASDIWLFHLTAHTSKQITDWEGTDSMPMWHEEMLYYLSDAGPDHRLNIWSYSTATEQRAQITHFADYDVKWPAMGPGPGDEGEIVFQCGPELYLLDLVTREPRAVDITIPGDRPKLRPQRINAGRDIQSWDVSPTGKRLLLEARGDIWTVPAEHGPPRNLTRSDGSAERNPSWSPDKKWIAYYSDQTGEYELYITQSDGKGETRQLTRDGRRYRYTPNWSPDSAHILFTDNSGSIFLHTLESGETRKLDQDPWGSIPGPNWSHDSRWITYSKQGDNQQHAIWVCSIETGQTHQLTSGMFSDYSPTFDRKGEYLYYASTRVFTSPIYDNIGKGFIYNGSQVLLAVPLRADMDYPWSPEKDEETWEEDQADEAGDENDNADDADEDDATDEAEADDASDGDDDDEPTVDDGISGVWEGQVTGSEPLPPGGLPFTMMLRTSDGQVSGTLRAGLFYATITDGAFAAESGEFTFTLEVVTPEETVTIAGSAQVSSDSMSGTLSGEDFDGAFDATRVSLEAPEAEDEETKADKGDEEQKPLELDLEGFERRALQLPVNRGHLGGLSVNDKNQLIFVRRGIPGSGDQAGINLFDIEDDKREVKTVVSGAGRYGISADGKKLVVRSGGSFSIIDARPGQKLGKKVSLDNLTVTVDPRAEWRQILIDAWRIQREFFYAENMHGVDWNAVRQQYLPLIDDCASREDLSFVISEMISELNVGHAYYSGGSSESTPSVSVGMLGCDFELVDGAYRITRLCEGGPWDSDARGPLSQPGVDVKVGDYLLAVNDVPIDTRKDPWAAFQGLANKDVALTVSQKPAIDDDAREVLVKTRNGEQDLRFRAWIEQNRAYVESQTEGRVGYIYVPDTGQGGQNELFRQFYGQRDKAALIIDERWNRGGQIPSRFVELLNRPALNYWARRHGKDEPWPPDSHQGPKCMLINGMSGSGGDCFPYYFRQAGLGKLIGMRTWGGLVGISGNPRLIDGHRVTVPRFAFFELDGTWGVEGHGVNPDIEVVDDPALMVAGGDPQLDAAIEHLLDELEHNAFQPPARPADPDRSGMGIEKEDM